MPGMTLLNEAVDVKKMDTRVVERNIARGVIPSQEVDKAVSALPDDAENAEYVSVEALAAEGVPPSSRN